MFAVIDCTPYSNDVCSPICLQLTDLLVSRGADVHTAADNGSTVLHLATKSGAGNLALLIDHGADPCTTTEVGQNALHTLCSSEENAWIGVAGATVG